MTNACCPFLCSWELNIVVINAQRYHHSKALKPGHLSSVLCMNALTFLVNTELNTVFVPSSVGMEAQVYCNSLQIQRSALSRVSVRCTASDCSTDADQRQNETGSGRLTIMLTTTITAFSAEKWINNHRRTFSVALIITVCKSVRFILQVSKNTLQFKAVLQSCSKGYLYSRCLIWYGQRSLTWSFPDIWSSCLWHVFIPDKKVRW